MSTQTLDYSMILADLEAKRAAIDATIASIRGLMGAGLLSQSGDPANLVGASQVVPSITGNEIPDGAFFGRSVPEAAKLLLEIVKKKQTTREIADGLRRGGIESTSSNFVGIVHAVMNRARKTPNSSLVKIGSYWGLKEWYPKGIVSAGAPASPKKKKKKPAKASAKVAPKTAKKPGESIADLLSNNPFQEFEAGDIARNFGMNPKVVQMVLGKLIQQNRAVKTANGAYQHPSGNATAATQ